MNKKKSRKYKISTEQRAPALKWRGSLWNGKRHISHTVNKDLISRIYIICTLNHWIISLPPYIYFYSFLKAYWFSFCLFLCLSFGMLTLNYYPFCLSFLSIWNSMAMPSIFLNIFTHLFKYFQYSFYFFLIYVTTVYKIQCDKIKWKY